jgi:DNA-binding transcriptional MerR regulator
MQIRDVVQHTGVPAKTIRYYEQIGLLPPPARTANNYRRYEPAVIDRLRFIVSARSLGLALADIAEILIARDQGVPPCDRVLELLATQLRQLDRRIADLVVLRADLRAIHAEGVQRPRDDITGATCVCALIHQFEGVQDISTTDDGQWITDDRYAEGAAWSDTHR